MQIDPEKYGQDVVKGKIVVSGKIKLAVERHYRDLKELKKEGYYFDPKSGIFVIQFFSLLKHYKGKWKGQSFESLPWQQWMLYVLYGWKNKDGSRRFRRAYVEVAKKNGKTAIGAGLCLYHLIGDNENAAEVYIAAIDKNQASLAFTDAKAFVKSSPSISKKVEIQNNSIFVPSNFSKIQALSRDRDSFEGKNGSFGLIDEYHLHKDDLALENLESGMATREQPMTFIITTAGFNKSLPCYKQRETCLKILDGSIKEESTFTMIFSPDHPENWHDQNEWIKANPSYPNTPTKFFLDDQYLKCVNTPTKQVSFKTKNMNIWTDAQETWIEDKQWVSCKGDVNHDYLKTIPAYGGLDLAATRDMNAFTLVFPDELMGNYKKITWYWVPKETMQERVSNDNIRYDLWADQGHLILTEGNVTDYRKIKADIMEICEAFQVQVIAYDRWNSSQLVIELTEEGISMHPYGQGFASMSQPTKTLENWVYSNQLIHDGSPVCRWNLSNVMLMKDPAGNIKPDKSKSSEKIDGIVSLIMGIGVMLFLNGEMANIGPSKYEDGGLTMV